MLSLVCLSFYTLNVTLTCLFRYVQVIHQSAWCKGKASSFYRKSWAYYTQTTNLIINLDHEEWILGDESAILAEIGFGSCHFSNMVGVITNRWHVENETEVSFFNRELYEKFKLNPEVRTFWLNLVSRAEIRVTRHGGIEDSIDNINGKARDSMIYLYARRLLQLYITMKIKPQMHNGEYEKICVGGWRTITG